MDQNAGVVKMFQKYSSIENFEHIRLDVFKDLDIESQRFVIQNKIDGSNISFIFSPERSDPQIASRNQVLGSYKTCNFQQSFQQAIENPIFEKFIEFFQNQAVDANIQIQIYGELFGPTVQKRVWYGAAPGILFFDMRINEKYLEQDKFYKTFIDNGFEELLVPTLAMGVSFQEAVSYNIEFQDPICSNSDQFRKNNPQNYSEGIVIKPLDKEFYSPCNERFVIKRKSPKFSETSPKREKQENSNEIPGALAEMIENFLGYINENRVLSYYSKAGPLLYIKYIGDYIKPILEDAAEDFCKDYGIWGTEERKHCFKAATPVLVEILKKSLIG